MEKVDAFWSVSLECECPHCGEDVNLLEHSDFWDGRQFGPVEHGTKNTKGVDVWCPKCNQEFESDFHY